MHLKPQLAWNQKSMLPRASSRLGFNYFDLQQPPWLGVEAATILTKNSRAEIQLQPSRGSTQSIEDFHLNPWHPKCPMDHVIFSGSYWLQYQEKTTIIGSRIQFLLRKKARIASQSPRQGCHLRWHDGCGQQCAQPSTLSC